MNNNNAIEVFLEDVDDTKDNSQKQDDQMCPTKNEEHKTDDDDDDNVGNGVAVGHDGCGHDDDDDVINSLGLDLSVESLQSLQTKFVANPEKEMEKEASSQKIHELLHFNVENPEKEMEKEASSEKSYEQEERKYEKMKMIVDADFPEFKMKSDEFFANMTETIDPKYLEGIKEAQRLNRILSEKMEKEKEVKHRGKLLRQKLYGELLDIKQHGRPEQQEEKANTQKFLSLTFTPEVKKFSDNKGKSTECEVQSKPKPPSSCSVFQTELSESDSISNSNYQFIYPELNLFNSELIDCKQRPNLPENLDEIGSQQNEAKFKTKKNFLKRNIQLAKEANSVVAMTPNEKQKVEHLLQDLDDINDLDQDNFESNGLPNRAPGEGFTTTREEKALMNEIDNKLKCLMSEDEFNSVASTQTSKTTERAFVSVVPPSDSEAIKTFGEKALLDSKEEREMREKLRKIDQEILAIYNDPLPDDLGNLDQNILLDLLESCASSMSGCQSNNNLNCNATPRETPDTEASPTPCPSEDLPISQCSNETSKSRSISNNLAQLMESPPYLPEDTLQRLLDDARPRSSCVATPQSRISCQSGSEQFKEGDLDLVWPPANFYYTTERSSLNSSLQDHFLPEISSSRSLVEIENNL